MSNDQERARPHGAARSEVDEARLTAAIHAAMCDVSHHDSFTVCKNARRYELVAASVARHYREPSR